MDQPENTELSRSERMLRSALGPLLLARLNDPAVGELMVNPDGRVWVERFDVGLVSGAPQLGAGAAVGTGLAIGGLAVAGAAAAQMAVGGGASLASSTAASGRAGGPPAGGGPTPGGAPSGGGPGPAPGGGSQGVSAQQGSANQGGSTSSGSGSGSGGEGGSTPPAWARDLKKRQELAQGGGLAAHALASGDDHSAGASPSLSET